MTMLYYTAILHLRNRKHVPCSYLNNRFVSVEEELLIVASQKFDVFKTNIYPRSFKGKYANFKNMKFARGYYQTDGSMFIVHH